MPNLVLITLPVSRYWVKIRQRYFPFYYHSNCHNSRASTDIDINAKKRQKNLILKSCWEVNFIVTFPIYGEFEAIQKLNTGRMVCKTYISSNRSLLSYKNWKRNKKISNIALILLPWTKELFMRKICCWSFVKNVDNNKI